MPIGSPQATFLKVSPNTVSANQRLKSALSLYCLNNSVSSLSSPTITRSNAASCSIRALPLSPCFLAFWYALSAATLAGISSVISLWTRSASVQGTLPNWSLNAFKMFDSRSSSGSDLCPPPLVGTGSISAF